MTTALSYLSSLGSIANEYRHRYLVRLVGSEQWKKQIISQHCTSLHSDRCYKLGGLPITGIEYLPYKEGAQLLGRELDCLIYDDIDGLDANSLTAASGALRGGGILFLCLSDKDCLSYRWLEQSLLNTIQIEEGSELPLLPKPITPASKQNELDEQQHAIELVEKAVTGHRKRPLILTADRGRGKSSALGMAAAKLITRQSARILVTAPSRKAVDPVFFHARNNLDTITQTTNNSLLSQQSYIKFVSPDELLKGEFECDLLLVDEASAIPVSMLKGLASRYHRTVFSSTIHGYEGCGRGFTLKFFNWLDSQRPGWKKYHIDQPIRWNRGDPLEAWIFNTFLLSRDVETIEYKRHERAGDGFDRVEKNELLSSPTLFKQLFTLLIDAHYQTSPNDMVQILDDDSVHVFVYSQNNKISGCIVVKQEGGLSTSLVDDILIGKRRPKGHLSPVIIAGQLGVIDAATCLSLRVMRIAVCPEQQNHGIGSHMLSKLATQTEISCDFISTSFGLSEELFRFWLKNGYSPIRLGSRLDPASGSHSLLMLKPISTVRWFDELRCQFPLDFIAMLPEVFATLPASLVLVLLKSSSLSQGNITDTQSQRIELYSKGGSCYENSAAALIQLVVCRAERVPIHPILVTKLLQKKSWKEVAHIYALSGKKTAEQYFRKQVAILWEFTV